MKQNKTKSARPGRGYITPCRGSGIYGLTAFDAFATCNNRGQNFLNLRCMTDRGEQLNLDIPLPALDADGVPTRGNETTQELQFFFNLPEFPAWRANTRSRNFAQFEYIEFCGRPFHAIVQFVGMRVSKKGYEYPNHRFYGLCDEHGRSAMEILDGAPAPGMRYRDFLRETSTDPTELITEQQTDRQTDDPIADLYTALKTLNRNC